MKPNEIIDCLVVLTLVMFILTPFIMIVFFSIGMSILIDIRKRKLMK